MNATNIHTNRLAPFGASFPTSEPLPARGAKKHRPPLEARTNWDPWLPLQEAAPEIPRPLQALTVLVLLLVGLFAVLVLFAQLAQ